MRSARRSTLEDFSSSHTSGCANRANQSSGMASAIASGSAFCSATAFGTSSPTTTER